VKQVEKARITGVSEKYRRFVFGLPNGTTICSGIVAGTYYLSASKQCGLYGLSKEEPGHGNTLKSSQKSFTDSEFPT